MTSTSALRALLRLFAFSRRRLPGRLIWLWGAEDEFAWRRLPFLRGRQVIVKNDRGQRLRVRLDSLGDLYAAFGRPAEQGVARVVRELPTGGVVLDIGAHIGGFSLLAANAVGPQGRVFAFEPVPGNHEILSSNARMNGIDCLVPIRAAAGRSRGHIELLVSDVDSMWASTRSTWAETLHHGELSRHVRAEQVELTTVDDFLAQQSISRVALMKIDVEGAEMDVLAGAAEALAAQRIDQVIVEVHSPPAKWDDVGALLNEYGYETRDLGGWEMHGVPAAPGRGRARATAKKPITVALIGCGAVSELLHAPVLERLAGSALTETVALVDPNPQRTAAVAKTLPGARPYQNLEMMLKSGVPDLAIVAVPHRLHPEVAVKCLEQGIHVLCEKPLAITSTDCDRMIETAATARRLLAVGHFRRFFPSCQMVRDVLRSQLLGAVKSFRFLEGEQYSWPAQSVFHFKRGEAGGGVLLDAGAHTIDLLLWWLGDVADVEYRDDAMGGVEANCELRLKMVSGAEGLVRLSHDWPLANRYVVECERGWIAYRYDVVDRVEWGLRDAHWGLNAEIRRMADGYRGQSRELGSPVPGFLEYFALQIQNVVAAVRGTAPLKVPAEEARKAVALIERCYRHRRPLAMPWLDDTEQEREPELTRG